MGRRSRYGHLSSAGRELRERLDRELAMVNKGGIILSEGDAGYTGGSATDPTGWGGQVPDMKQMQDGAVDLDEYGAPGTAIFNGIITGEEYNPDFEWRNGVRIYDQMRKNDYQVFASLLMCEVPIRHAKYKIAPASADPQHVDQASFIETALFHELDQPWDDVVRHGQLSRAYGFYLAEKVFKKGKDGMIYWQKFAPRMPKTIWRWWIDDSNELVGVQQWTFKDFTYKYINIPASKLMVFTHRQEGNNFEGTSVLRTAYKPWYYKELLLRIMGIGFEREHVGIPVFKLPRGHTAADIKKAATMGRNMRANEQAYLTIPDTWIVEWLKGQGGSRSSAHTPILDAISLMDVAISRNVLSQSMNLGSSETGAYNVAEEQNEIFMLSEQSDANEFVQVFNNQRVGAIPQLIKMNFSDPEIYPTLEVGRMSSIDMVTMANAIAQMARGGILTVTPDIEDYVREMMGIPSAPLSVIEATKLGAAQTEAGVNPTTGQPLNPHPLDIQRAEIAAKGGQNDPRGSGDTRSKGPGQDSTVTTNEIVPPEYRTQRYLGNHRHPMSRLQRHVYAQQVRRIVDAQSTYELLSEADWNKALANRVTPASPGHVRREDVLKRRLKRTYGELENTLVGIGEEALKK